jgi:hypothetical protein
MSGQRLTGKEEGFCRAVALQGLSLSDAYRASRDVSRMTAACIHANAKKIRRRPHVQHRIEELSHKVEAEAMAAPGVWRPDFARVLRRRRADDRAMEVGTSRVRRRNQGRSPTGRERQSQGVQEAPVAMGC